MIVFGLLFYIIFSIGKIAAYNNPNFLEVWYDYYRAQER
jgi:hypothetical protein